MRFAVPSLTLLVLSSCASSECAPKTTATASAPADPASRATPLPPDPPVTHVTGAPASAPDAGEPDPRASFVAWLKERVPAGDEVVAGDTGAVEVLHTVAKGEIPADLAHAYIALADVYSRTNSRARSPAAPARKGASGPAAPSTSRTS